LFFCAAGHPKRVTEMTTKTIAPNRLPAAQVEPAKRRARRPTLASVAKQASKAGIEVERYEVEPDKIVVIVVGKSGMDNAATTNEWDQEFDGAASEIH